MATHSPTDVAAAIKAYDVRGVVGEGAGFLNEEFVRDVAASFARLMREEGAQQIVIGHDMRDSSPRLAAAFADGVNAQGLNTVTLGLTSTDELYYASGVKQCPGAMFTASHNPAKYNGISCAVPARARWARIPGWIGSPPSSSTVCPPTTVSVVPTPPRTCSRATPRI